MKQFRKQLLLIPPSNTMLKLLVILFVIKLYAQINIFKIVNVYIVYDLDAWPGNHTNNFKFKNCLFGATSVVKNKDKEKYVYRGYRIIFDKASLWSFDNGIARNAIISSVDNSSSSHAYNVLVLGEGPTFIINGRFFSPEKKICINFSKANTKSCLRLHYNADNSYLLIE